MTTEITAVRTTRPRQWLQSFVFGLDDHLRKRYRVYEYTSHPDCIFRIQRDRAGCNFRFSDGTLLKASDPVISLHLWNEHIPLMTEEGPTIAWARRVKWDLEFSLGQLARHIETRHAYDGIRAIKADMTIGTAEKSPNLAWLATHCGFEAADCDDATLPIFERVHRIGENILGLMFVLATNPTAARLNILRRGRALVYMSRKTLIDRHIKARRP